MTIVLQAGPCDGEIHHRLPEECLVFSQFTKSPDARYEDSGESDANGRRIFKHAPHKPGDADEKRA